MSDEISIGRIVHFVVDQVSGVPLCRPGIVVETFTRPGASPHGVPGICNMQVFTDGLNDGEFATVPHIHNANILTSQVPGEAPVLDQARGLGEHEMTEYAATVWKTSVTPQHAARVPHTWHWPRECAEMVNPEAGHNHPPGMVDPTGCTACRASEDANVERGV